ncbi:MAG: TonB-dependent receptor domain-containing protein [Gammaproteobacteria bacterium]
MKESSLRKLRALATAVSTIARAARGSTFARGATVVTIAMTGSALYAQDVEEISVTGSRITRPGLVSQTPVTSLSQEEMDILAPTTLGDALDALPQFRGSTNLGDTQNMFGGGYLGNGGQSNLNLRGVGGSRTLVLLDGRRFVPSNRYGQVDINLFPSALIQRTEVVTGGASAAYGSDAVTGVSNFILNNEFEGLSINTQYGASELGDAKNYKISAGGGVAVGERGNFVWGLEGFKSDEITDYRDRDWFQAWGDLDFGPGVTPRRVRYADVSTRGESFGGLIRRGPLAGTVFDSNGNPTQFQAGSVLDLSAQNGLRTGVIQGTQVGGTGSNNQSSRYDMVRAANERYALYMNYQHRFTDTTTGSVMLLHGSNFVDNQKIGYVMSGTWPVTIYSGNPFLPASVQQRMTAGNIPSFTMDKRVVPWDPLNNNRAPTDTYVSAVAFSLDGEFSNGWTWSTYYSHGQNSRDVDLYGFRVDRMFKGIDSVRDANGRIVCASTLIQPNDGCVPVNIFGIGQTSAEAREWLHDKAYTDATYKQDSAEFMVNGEIFEGFGAGPVFLATGVNWRDDSVKQVSGDAFGPLPEPGQGYITDRDANGNLLYRGLPSVYLRSVPVVDRINAASYSGSIDVYEGFGEINVPVLSEAAWADRLDVNLAARYTKYSTIDAVWAWKGGMDWQIYDDLRVRLTRSRDIRAGNMTELFDTTATNAFIEPGQDPLRPGDERYIAKNVNGGNPNVEPEEADTITYGFVYQPSWLEGAALSIDYYDIKIKDAISNIGVNNILDFCGNQGVFCDLIEREPGGRISAINNTTVNVGEARTRGLDYELSYRAPVTWFDRDDSLSMRVIASRLISSTISPFNAPTVEQVGVGDRQDLSVTLTANYTAGPVTAAWSTRWVSDAKRNNSWVEGIDVADNSIPSHHLSNLRLTYDLGESFGSNSSVYVAVTNIFDKNQGDLQMLTGIYDVVGRNYSLGFNYRL